MNYPEQKEEDIIDMSWEEYAAKHNLPMSDEDNKEEL